MNLLRVFNVGLFFMALSISSKTQVLISYGGSKVSKEEFLRAFSKNNTDKHPTEKAYRDYLELFTRFKLKVKAAYGQKIDTLPAQISELENFKRQVSEGYLRDDKSYQNLVTEAFKRSLKDIRLAHIFIPLTDTSSTGGSNTIDSGRAGKQAMAAFEELKKGRDFSDVARKYSADSSVKTNGGDIGYITVFTLPYELENIAYGTPLGTFSTPFRSNMGYHIFKKISERPALGKIKVAQILFAFPPGASEQIKSATRLRADSVYQLLKNGASFSDLARQFSNDNSSYLNGGELPEFGVGTFAPVFEEQVFALPANGALSRPILTEQGYHLVKRLVLTKINTDPGNDSAMAELKQQVGADTRLDYSKRIMARKLALITHFKQANIPAKLLWEFSDSSLAGKKLPKGAGLTEQSLLFSFPGRSIYLTDWLSALQVHKPPSGTIASQTYPKLLEQFRDEKILEYYRDHLESYNTGFAALALEFKEGNLLFEIMQRYVWDKASADSAGLEDYYRRNKNRYVWQSGVDAVIFTCTDSAVANECRAKFETAKKDWRTSSAYFENKVSTDSGRFETVQLPVNANENLQPGKLTSMFRNEGESNISFAYIIKLYPKNLPRTFEEARGFVLNDYQDYIEQTWVKSLKQKYPVQVNESVLRTLWK